MENILRFTFANLPKIREIREGFSREEFFR